MKHSRANPSQRYLDLQSLYREMHSKGEQFLGTPPEETFPGFSLDPQMFRIKTLIDRTSASTLLDYGCGKGMQYEPRSIKFKRGDSYRSVQDYWGIETVACYDPCFGPNSTLPEGKFDGVISTDVLEHCPEEDVPWIVDEIFAYATKFVFANVACFPAKKRLPNGENAHCTIKSVDWWRDLVGGIAASHAGVTWEVWLEQQIETPEGVRSIEHRLSDQDSA